MCIYIYVYVRCCVTTLIFFLRLHGSCAYMLLVLWERYHFAGHNGNSEPPLQLVGRQMMGLIVAPYAVLIVLIVWIVLIVLIVIIVLIVLIVLIVHRLAPL